MTDQRKKDNPNVGKTKKAIESNALFQSESSEVQSLEELKEQAKAERGDDGTENSTDNSSNARMNTDQDTIKLEKQEKPTLLQRAYYLRPEQVHMIDYLSEETGLDKSELVRRALDEFVKRVQY